MSLLSVSRGTRQMPVEEGLSEYGSYILAPQLPNAPSRYGVETSLKYTEKFDIPSANNLILLKFSRPFP